MPVKEINGEYYKSEVNENERRPFKAILDLGLKNSTNGNRVFACVKGICDGGINIPHGE